MDRIFPRWARSWGELARSNALVRSQCLCCGLQQRVDAASMAALRGGSSSPLDALDRCSVVGCHGETYFLVARSYGRRWIAMAARTDILDAIERGAPPANAMSLGLLESHSQAVAQGSAQGDKISRREK